MFYSFYRAYTKIFMIFESAQLFLYTIKHKSNFCTKGKRKSHCAASGLGTRPAGRPTHARPIRVLRAPTLLLTASLTTGPRCQLRLQAPAGRINGATGPIALPPATGTADGHLGRTSAGRYERVERKPKSA